MLPQIMFLLIIFIKMEISLPIYHINLAATDATPIPIKELTTTPDPEDDLGPANKLPTDSPNEMIEIHGTEWINYDSNEYKWNKADHGPKMTISEDGFISNHSGENVYNCVRAVLPIPEVNMTKIKKPRFGFYFEVEILVNR